MALGLLVYWLKCLTMALLSQFKFPSPFTRAYLHSPQLVQEALETFNIGPFQADGELLCMCFLQPCDNPPRADGVGSRPWEAFRRVLEDLGSVETQSVIPSEQWKQWFLGLDERVPFSPTDAADLERSLWQIMEKVTCGKPSYTFTPREYGWEHHDREMWQSRHRPPPITQLQLAKWRHWRPAQLRDLEPTTQRALEEKLRQHWSNRLISHLAPHASDIPAMAAVMGDGNDHEEFLHLLGDARFSTLRQRCLALEKLKKHGGLQIAWTEKSVRSLLSNLHKEECTPNYIQQAWDTLKWFSTKFQTLDVTATHRLAAKKKWLQETLVSTASTPQRKAVVPAKEVILALEQGAAAGGADPRRKGQIAREAIDAFILGMVRFQVGSSARFNDLQHTSPSTMKVTSNTIEMMAWQTKTASAFRIKKNPVPLIAPKLSLSGWWTEWSKTLTLLSSLERFQNMDYLIPTLSKDFQGVIRGFIHDELQAHLLAPVASNDLDKAGSTTALLPKALAMLTHIATSGDTLLFANNLPRRDGAQDQSTLSFGPKDVLLFSPHLLFGILAHHRVHIFNGNGGAWLIRIFHQQRSLGRGASADASCTHCRSPNWQVWIQTKGPNRLIGVVQLAIQGSSMEKRSSHHTWLGSGAAPWNQPRLPPANPSQEPACG